MRFSADTWTEQLHHFITERIGEPVYIAGNSLGEQRAVAFIGLGECMYLQL